MPEKTIQTGTEQARKGQGKDPGFVKKLAAKWQENPLYSTGAVLIIMILVQTFALGFDYSSFGEWFSNWLKNWINILRNNAPVGIVALGMAFVIISGGIDLAVGSTLVAVGAVMMVLINGNPNGLLTAAGISGVPSFIIGILAALAMGCLIGSINGFLIARTKIPAFIATLGMMKICRSVTQQYMQTVGVKVPREFTAIANTKIGGEIILPIFYWLIIAAILVVVARKTPFGRHVYAIGSNERSARLSGINVERVKAMVYILSGLLVSIAAVINIARIGSMDYANAGSGYEMDAIAAVVVGGTSMSGGRGSIVGTVLGMLIIAVMNNLLNLIGVPPFLREAFKGLIVIVAVLLQKKDKAS
jgi:ribose transport system permease protein